MPPDEVLPAQPAPEIPLFSLHNPSPPPDLAPDSCPPERGPTPRRLVAPRRNLGQVQLSLASGLNTGSRLRKIRAAYGPLPLATTCSVPGGVCYLCDAGAWGIAFETNGKTLDSKCTAIIVHLPKLAAKKFCVSMAQYLHSRTKPR